MLKSVSDYLNILITILDSEDKYTLTPEEKDLILNDEVYNYTLVAILSKFIMQQKVNDIDDPDTLKIVDKYFDKNTYWHDETKKTKSIRNCLSHETILYDNKIQLNSPYLKASIDVKDLTNLLFDLFDNNKTYYMELLNFINDIRYQVSKNRLELSRKYLVFPYYLLRIENGGADNLELIRLTHIFSETKKNLKNDLINLDDINYANVTYYIDFSEEFINREKKELSEYIDKLRDSISSYAISLYQINQKLNNFSLNSIDKRQELLTRKEELEFFKTTSEQHKELSIKKLEVINETGKLMPTNWEFIRRIRNSFVHDNYEVVGDYIHLYDYGDECPSRFDCYITYEQLCIISNSILDVTKINNLPNKKIETNDKGETVRIRY